MKGLAEVVGAGFSGDMLMLSRGLAAILGLTFFLFALWEGGWLWVGMTVLLALLTLAQWQQALQGAGRPFLAATAYASLTAALLGLVWLPSHAQGPALLAVLWVFLLGTLLSALWRFPDESPLLGAGSTVLITLWVAVGFGSLLLLRRMEGPAVVPWGATAAWQAGLRWCLLPLLCTWAIEATAMFRNRWLQGQALAPTLSADITWQGLLAGLVGGVAAGLAVGLELRFPWWQGLAVGFTCGLLASPGRLAFSALRSDLGRESPGSSPLGLADLMVRNESLLINLPAVYLLALLWG